MAPISTAPPIETHQSIPIHLKQVERDRSFWLQWQRGRQRYGVRLTNMEESLQRARKMIDAMLELENARSYQA